jgi:hypothetical protein
LRVIFTDTSRSLLLVVNLLLWDLSGFGRGRGLGLGRTVLVHEEVEGVSGYNAGHLVLKKEGGWMDR